MTFTTLYRDNYNRVSGCAGEGCGKHPGVDIGVTKGTTAYASLAGTVIRADCTDATWGGLVVIKAVNPRRTSEYVYLSYAHLSVISVNKGTTVTDGQVIGKTGGVKGEACSGVSFAQHLHFQIDKTWTVSNIPWYPKGRVEDKDTDLEVTRYTYNPVVLIQDGYTWTFEKSGYFEFWKTYNVPYSSVSGGALLLDSSYSDAAIFRVPGDLTATACTGGNGAKCNPEITVEAALYKYIYVNLDLRCPLASSSVPMTFYFYRDNVGWSGFNMTYNGPGWYGYNLSNFSSWTGIIRGIWLRTNKSCNSGTVVEYSIPDLLIF